MQPSKKDESAAMRHLIMKEFLSEVRKTKTKTPMQSKMTTTTTTESIKFKDPHHVEGNKEGDDDAISTLDRLRRISLQRSTKPIINISTNDEDDSREGGKNNGGVKFENGENHRGSPTAIPVSELNNLPKNFQVQTTKTMTREKTAILGALPSSSSPTTAPPHALSSSQPSQRSSQNPPPSQNHQNHPVNVSARGSNAFAQGSSWSMASSFAPISTLFSKVSPGGDRTLFSRGTAVVHQPPQTYFVEPRVPVLYKYVAEGGDAFVSASSNYTATTCSNTTTVCVEGPPVPGQGENQEVGSNAVGSTSSGYPHHRNQQNQFSSALPSSSSNEHLISPGSGFSMFSSTPFIAQSTSFRGGKLLESSSGSVAVPSFSLPQGGGGSCEGDSGGWVLQEASGGRANKDPLNLGRGGGIISGPASGNYTQLHPPSLQSVRSNNAPPPVITTDFDELPSSSPSRRLLVLALDTLVACVHPTDNPYVTHTDNHGPALIPPPPSSQSVGKHSRPYQDESGLAESSSSCQRSDAVLQEGKLEDGTISSAINVFYRPHLAHFIATVSKFFDIAIFSTGEQDYVDALLDVMDPSGQVFPKSRRYYRQHCTKVDSSSGTEQLAKDLKILDRPLNEVVLVDDTASSGSLQPNNLLLVSTWTGDSSDTALLRLADDLVHISQSTTSSADVDNCEPARA